MTVVLGIEPDGSYTVKAVGVSGHSIAITACSKVLFEIAGYKVTVLLYFSDNLHAACSESYDAIVGCDVLKFFPPFVIDLKRGIFTMNDQSMALGSAILPQLPTRVGILNHVSLMPHTETFVSCYLDDIPSEAAPLLLLDNFEKRPFAGYHTITPGLYNPRREYFHC